MASDYQTGALDFLHPAGGCFLQLKLVRLCPSSAQKPSKGSHEKKAESPGKAESPPLTQRPVASTLSSLSSSHPLPCSLCSSPTGFSVVAYTCQSHSGLAWAVPTTQTSPKYLVDSLNLKPFKCLP